MSGILGIIDHNDELSIVIKGLIAIGENEGVIPGIITIGKNGGLNFFAADDQGYFGKNKIANDNNKAQNSSGYQVAVVHDGVIDAVMDINGNRVKDSNFLKNFLIKKLIDHYLANGRMPEEAVAETVKHIAGSYALAVLIAGNKNIIIAVNSGFPLVIGKADGKNYLGSRSLSLSSFTTCITRTEKGDFVTLEKNKIQLWDINLNQLKRPLQISASLDGFSLPVNKPQQKNYTKNDIFRQPETLKQTLGFYTSALGQGLLFPDLPYELPSISQINLVTCSASYFAGMIGKYILEKLARLPVSLEAASEFRYRNAPIPPTGMCLFISPMEKNADIGAAMLHAREKNHKIIGLLGKNNSYLEEYCQAILPNAAMAETGIISVKGYTSQLLVLECMAIFLAQARGARTAEECGNLFATLGKLPELVQEIFALEEQVIRIAHIIKDSTAIFFTGRGMSYPVALSGAWKTKILSAVYSDAIAGGELRNGAFSLITSRTPTIAIAPSGTLFAKTRSDIRDILKQGGRVIAITDTVGAKTLQEIAQHLLVLPTVHPLIAPVTNTVVLQLLSYHLSQVKTQYNRQARPAVKSVIIKRREKIFGPGAGMNNFTGGDGLNLG